VKNLLTSARARETGLYAGVAAATLAIAYAVLEMWKTTLSDPISYWGDALAVSAHFKTVIETGWYENQPLLGAPTGQVYHDFPTADNLHLVAARILSLFTHDWVVAVNVYYLVGFVLAAMSALWLLRRVGISAAVAAALAIAYALAPYHFVRGIGHLWLASYYAVPLGIGIVLAVLQRERLWSLGRGGWLRRIVWSRAALHVVFLGLLAASSTYYAVFYLVMLGMAGIAVWLRDRDWKAFGSAVVAGVVTVVWMVINMLPDMVYEWRNGPNPDGLVRSRGEAEVYALKFTQLVLPWAGHRIDALAAMRQRYDSSYVVLGEPPALGALAAFGFVMAFIVVGYLVVATMKVDRTRTAADDLARRLAAPSFMVLVAFMFASVGGLATIISFLTPNLRGWNRMSIDIAILSLVITGILVDAVLRWLTQRLKVTWRHAASAVVALGLVGVAVIDQTPSAAGQSYAAVADAYHADQEYFGQLEQSLPEGSLVVMAQYIPYPESQAPSGELASGQLVAYLNTHDVYWSNGGIKGRPAADWAGTIPFYGLDNFAAVAALSGAEGVLVDRGAFVDGGVALEEQLHASLPDVAPAVSASGRWAYYSLAELPADSAPDLVSRIVDPVVAYLADGSTPWPDDPATPSIPMPQQTLAFDLVNDSGEARDIDLAIGGAATGAGELVTVTIGSMEPVQLRLSEAGDEVTIPVAVAPGSTSVTITRVDPDPDVAVTVTVPRATDRQVAQAAAELRVEAP